MTQPSPAPIEAGIESLIKQALAQGLPAKITDPGVLTRVAAIVREARGLDVKRLSEPR